MIPLAMNLVALVIVLGLCWAAMMWLGKGSHGQRYSTQDASVDAFVPRHIDLGPSESDSYVSLHNEHAPCAVCEGVGAQQTAGKLAPCSECLGTGVLT